MTEVGTDLECSGYTLYWVRLLFFLWTWIQNKKIVTNQTRSHFIFSSSSSLHGLYALNFFSYKISKFGCIN